MALELNGTTGVNLIQDGTVSAADLASGAITSSALPTGSVIQVVHNSGTSIVSNSTVSSPGSEVIDLDITPSSTSSKILVLFSLTSTNSASSNSYVAVEFVKDGSIVYTLSDGEVQNNTLTCSYQYYDSPATTSSINYAINIRKGSSGTTSVSTDGKPYYITAMEIAG